MTDRVSWRNRIVGHGVKPADQFQAHPDNWRGHPQHQREAVRGSLNELGWVDTVIENVTTGHVVDGHERIWQALQNDNADVPYIQVDLTEEEERLALAILDPITNMATTDAEKLDALLADIRTGDAALQAMLSELAKGAGLSFGEEPAEDPGPQLDRAEELREKWGVESGQLWQLGEHRLICGDCTDRVVVDAVAFGDRMDLWLTDPPYGVSYADKNRYLNAVAFGNRIQVPIANDHLTLDETTELWRKAFGLVFEIAKPGCVYYVHAPQGGDLMMMMMMMLRECGWLLKPQIIWVKNNHVLGRSDYQLKHEPILYGWREGPHFWIGSRSEMSVWQVDKPQNSDFHPVTKPVELAEKAIQNSSRLGEIVFDGFLGSGTTMVAAHRLGRRCFGIEVDPGYCAVTLERMSGLGVTPVLVE